MRGEVLVVERLGGETYLHLDVGAADPFVVKTDGAVSARSGEHVGLAFPPHALHLFSASGAAFPHRERHRTLAEPQGA